MQWQNNGDNNSIFAPVNKYGYRININHPSVLPLYEEFKRRKNAIILSDEERLEFEAIIFKMIEKRRKNNAYPNGNDGKGDHAEPMGTVCEVHQRQRGADDNSVGTAHGMGKETNDGLSSDLQ